MSQTVTMREVRVGDLWINPHTRKTHRVESRYPDPAGRVVTLNFEDRTGLTCLEEYMVDVIRPYKTKLAMAMMEA